MSNDLERRYTPGQVEVRGGDRRTIGGYAAKFDRTSRNLGGFVEVIAPTAFNRARGNGWPDVICRYNHDDNMLLGTTAAGTLELNIDNVGLTYDVDPPQARADVYELVQRRDVNKSSFAFRVIGDDGDEWGLSEQNYNQRTLHSVELVDVAPVIVPAYQDTSSGVRNVEIEGAYRSLARKMHAPLEDVVALAEADELRRFFTTTSTVGTKKVPTRPIMGPDALMKVMALEQAPPS